MSVERKNDSTKASRERLTAEDLEDSPEVASNAAVTERLLTNRLSEDEARSMNNQSL